MFDDAWLAGPIGGIVAMAFGAGAASGYGFAARTVLRVARDRMIEMRDDARRNHEDCERQLANMQAELTEYRDILMGKLPMPRFLGDAVTRGKALDKQDEEE